MPEIDPLLAAVEALTKPQRTKHLQDVIYRWTTKDDGIEHEHEKVTGQKLITVTLPPLLDQFRDATNPSTNTTAGASALASMRNILDSTALYEYSKIASQILDWCRIVKADVVRDNATTNLQRWHVKWVGANNEDAATKWYVGQLRMWASLIRAHLDPPRRRDIMCPCPICGKTVWGSGDEGGMWPLEMRYRLDADDKPVVESVICRACEPVTTWSGRESVDELFEELEENSA